MATPALSIRASKIATAGNVDELDVFLNEHPVYISGGHHRFRKQTLMHIGAKNGRLQVIELLMKRGSEDLDQKDSHGWTPLHEAANKGKLAVVEAIVRLGSKSLNDKTKSGDTCMHLALRNNKFSVAVFLADEGSEAAFVQNAKKKTLLSIAAEHCGLDAVKFVYGLNPGQVGIADENKETPFFKAVAKNKLDVVAFLHSVHQDDIDAHRWDLHTPMIEAAGQGSVEMVELLVRLGSRALNFSTKAGHSALTHAAQGGHLIMTETLIRLGAIVESPLECERRYTIMHAFASCNSVEGVELSARHGVDLVNKVDGNGCTPLHIAATFNSAAVIEPLVRLGCTKANNLCLVRHSTALECAIYSGSRNCVDELLRLRVSELCSFELTHMVFFNGKVMSDCKRALARLIILHGHRDMQIFDTPEKLKLAQSIIEKFTDEEALDARYQVFFSRSLVNQLLFCLSKQKHLVSVPRLIHSLGQQIVG